MVDPRELPDFNEPQLAMAIEALPSETVDALPYGAIRIGDDGKVEYYSAAERRLSGSGNHDRLGLDFFSRIAPVWTILTFAVASSVPGYRACSIWSSATSATSRTATGN